MLPENFPTPLVYTRGSGEPVLRWGVAGPGGIAGIWAATVHKNTDQKIVAVGSRSRERAERFASEHGIERAHGSYRELVADPGVDAVYIAVPQSEHLALGLLAIDAGKHVLIEKPLAMDRAEGEELARAAHDAGVMLMEGMWSRYLPQASVIRDLVADGVLGDIRHVVADHGQAVRAFVGPDHRMFRPELGGGALLDLGIYPVQLDSMVRGAPTGIRVAGGLTPTGVDEYATVILEHGKAATSTVFTSMATRTPSTGFIAGSTARLELPDSINGPSRLVLSDNGYFTPQRVWEDPTGLADLDALAWEATAFAQYVGEGRLESPVHSLDETVSILGVLAEARRQLGVLPTTAREPEPGAGA